LIVKTRHPARFYQVWALYFGALAGAVAALAHGAQLSGIMLLGASIYILGKKEISE
jgi:hypothetical protein